MSDTNNMFGKIAKAKQKADQDTKKKEFLYKWDVLQPPFDAAPDFLNIANYQYKQSQKKHRFFKSLNCSPYVNYVDKKDMWCPVNVDSLFKLYHLKLIKILKYHLNKHYTHDMLGNHLGGSITIQITPLGHSYCSSYPQYKRCVKTFLDYLKAHHNQNYDKYVKMLKFMHHVEQHPENYDDNSDPTSYGFNLGNLNKMNKLIQKIEK